MRRATKAFAKVSPAKLALVLVMALVVPALLSACGDQTTSDEAASQQEALTEPEAQAEPTATGAAEEPADTAKPADTEEFADTKDPTGEDANSGRPYGTVGELRLMGMGAHSSNDMTGDEIDLQYVEIAHPDGTVTTIDDRGEMLELWDKIMDTTVYMGSGYWPEEDEIPMDKETRFTYYYRMYDVSDVQSSFSFYDGRFYPFYGAYYIVRSTELDL